MSRSHILSNTPGTSQALTRALLALAVLVAALLVTLFFQVAPAQATMNNPGLPRVIDDAGVLSSTTEQELEERIAVIQDTYDYDVVLMTTYNTGVSPYDDDATAYNKAMVFADDYYDNHGYGNVGDRSGMILVMDPYGHVQWTSTCGYGIYAFTDYGINELTEATTSAFGNGDYDRGFKIYMKRVERFLARAANGDPVDVYSPDRYIDPVAVGVTFLACLLISFLIARGIRARMTSVGRYTQRSANNYIDGTTLVVQALADIRLYSNVTRVKRVEMESKGGGGGFSGGSTVHMSGGGFSHGGGGGRF